MPTDIVRYINSGIPFIRNECIILYVPQEPTYRITMNCETVTGTTEGSIEIRYTNRFDDINYYKRSEGCTVINNVFYNGSQHTVQYSWTPLDPVAPNIIVQRSSDQVTWFNAELAFNDGQADNVSLPGGSGTQYYLRVLQSNASDVPLCTGAVYGPFTVTLITP